MYLVFHGEISRLNFDLWEPLTGKKSLSVPVQAVTLSLELVLHCVPLDKSKLSLAVSYFYSNSLLPQKSLGLTQQGLLRIVHFLFIFLSMQILSREGVVYFTCLNVKQLLTSLSHLISFNKKMSFMLSLVFLKQSML